LLKEYESTSWVNAFNVSYSLAQTIALFAEALAVDPSGAACARLASLAIGRIASRLQLSPAFQVRQVAVASTPTVVPVLTYQVSAKPVSFHNTINWLAGSALFQLYQLLSRESDFSGWSRAFDAAVDRVPTDFLAVSRQEFAAMAAMELPLRVTVLLAQVRAGLWVRNGYSIRNQVSLSI
jgi:E3 ubiquitin-protein ligase UBR1